MLVCDEAAGLTCAYMARSNDRSETKNIHCIKKDDFGKEDITYDNVKYDKLYCEGWEGDYCKTGEDCLKNEGIECGVSYK